MNQKRQFTHEFKKEAVALVVVQDYTAARAAVSLGSRSNTLHLWVSGAINLERDRGANVDLSPVHYEKIAEKKVSCLT